MKPCKAKLSDGNSCPNQVDEGQEYCPYHLSSQVADEVKKLKTTGIVLGLISIYKIAEPYLGKAAKFIVSKKL